MVFLLETDKIKTLLKIFRFFVEFEIHDKLKWDLILY